jgi:DNA invertase Pin-like site-specific DNA recombinase
MLTYFIYCRKSTETEDRQVLSIESQINELTRIAKQLNLPISEIFTESKSAKAPGRPVFNQMMQRVYKGEAKGIICWKLDRLARNPIDGGSIIWAIKQHNIEIVTPAQTYSAESDNLMLMYIEFGMAQKYIDDLSKNVKRGNRTKLEKGQWLGVAPQGYLNDMINKTIIKDPERFDLIKKAWGLLLTGTYTVSKIHKILNNKWGYRTRKTKRIGGNPMALSGLYKVFSNPFYYGWIARKEGQFQGCHEPMITKDKFDHAQIILAGKGRPRPKSHNFSFTGMIRCGECGAFITAEEKTNRFNYHYTYYHCTKRKPHIKCSQKSIQLEKLEKQIVKYLSTITLSDKFTEVALEYVQQLHQKEVNSRKAIYQSLQNAYNQVQSEFNNLTQMRLRNLLTDEEYLQQKSELLRERAQLQERLKDNDHRVDMWLKLTENTFIFANRAKYWFKNGSLEDKKQILETIGSNLILKDKKLFIEAKKPFLILKKGLARAEQEKLMFEPAKSGLNAEQTSDLQAQYSYLLGLVEDVRTFFKKYLFGNSKDRTPCIYIPDLRDEFSDAA